MNGFAQYAAQTIGNAHSDLLYYGEDTPAATFRTAGFNGALLCPQEVAHSYIR
jgi:hypothetical protein